MNDLEFLKCLKIMEKLEQSAIDLFENRTQDAELKKYCKTIRNLRLKGSVLKRYTDRRQP